MKTKIVNVKGIDETSQATRRLLIYTPYGVCTSHIRTTYMKTKIVNLRGEDEGFVKRGCHHIKKPKPNTNTPNLVDVTTFIR
jgi:hypothetical protein